MASRKTHGGCPRGKQSKKYTCWCNIKRRVTNAQHPAFRDYGGRGIEMCAEWYASFAAFDRDVPDAPSPELTLERLDNSKGYEPGNVDWVSRLVQGSNKRNNVRLTFRGRTETIAEWSRELGIKSATIRNRVRLYGWTVEEALTGKREFSVPNTDSIL